MKKRIISVMLAAAMILPVAGCGGKKNNAGSGDFENAPVVRFAVMNSYEKALGASGDNALDNPYIRYIYEQTGVRVEPVFLSTNESEASQQLAVKRAGGEQIDLILDWDIRQAYMQAGLTIKLNDLLDEYKDKIPNILNNIPDEAWNGLSKRGQIWGIPGRYTLPNPDIKYVFFRKDWMDKLNLKMPENTDELGEIMRAFTEDDPDGNGVKDTYAFVHNGDNTVNSLMLLFGCNSWNETYENGRFENGVMTDRARKAFAVLRKWDKAGYINHDGIADSKAHDALISSNRAGMVIGSPAKLLQYQNALHDNGFVDAEWVLCDKQIKSSVDGIFWGYAMAGKNHASATSITSMAKDYDSIFKLLNWAYSKEGTFFLSYGLEGKEYNMVDGKPVRDANYVKDKSYLRMFNFGKSYNDYYEELAYETYGDGEFAHKYVDEVVNNYDFYIGKPSAVAIKFDYPDLKEFTDYPDWRKGVSTNMMKFVVGDLDPADDATWNKYIEDCNSYGVRKLLDAALKAYNEDTERPDKIDLEEYFK